MSSRGSHVTIAMPNRWQVEEGGGGGGEAFAHVRRGAAGDEHVFTCGAHVRELCIMHLWEGIYWR
jgi:hypothetical protein